MGTSRKYRLELNRLMAGSPGDGYLEALRAVQAPDASSCIAVLPIGGDAAAMLGRASASAFEPGRLGAAPCGGFVLYAPCDAEFSLFWDVYLLDQMSRLEQQEGGGKAVLTGFHGDGPFGLVPVFGGFLDGTRVPRFVPGRAAGRDVPAPGAFVGEYLFGPADALRLQGPDGSLSSPAAMGAAVWCGGYQVRHPGFAAVRGTFPAQDIAASQRETDFVFGVDGSVPGLDPSAVRQYVSFSGLDCRCGVAMSHACEGIFPVQGACAVAYAGYEPVGRPGHAMCGTDLSGIADAGIWAIVDAHAGNGSPMDTVSSLVRNAHAPERVHVVVVAQEMPGLDIRMPGVQVIRCGLVGAGEAFRAGEQAVPDGADYVLYTEGSMHFLDGWDIAYAAYSRYCGGRAVLSDWAPAFDGDIVPRVPYRGCVTCARGVSEHGHPHLVFGREIRAGRPVRGAFTTNSMVFAPAEVACEVPHLPGMALWSNESSMAYRYWCAGIDVYHSPRRFCMLPMARDGDPAVSARLEEMDRRSMEALGHMLEGKGPCLGGARTVRSFAMFSGADRAAGKAYARSALGMFGDDFGFRAPVGSWTDCRKDGSSWVQAADGAVHAVPADRAICRADGCSYVGSARDVIIMGSMARTGRVWASEEMDMYLEMAKRHYGRVPGTPGLFCDVGANIGTTCVHFRKNLDSGVRILALEPVRDTYDMLRANLALNGIEDAVTANLGVSGDGGSYGMTYNPGNPGASFLTGGAGGVRTIRFDDFLKAMGIPVDGIKYVWVDIEGFEGAFLSGAMETLRSARFPVAMEFSPHLMCRLGHARMFWELASSLWTGFVRLESGDDRVHDMSELRWHFDGDFDLAHSAQYNIFMI